VFDIDPLPWVGGKRRLVHRFIDRLEAVLRPGIDYTEPFAGGAAVALTLLDRNPRLGVWLNDAYRPVYAFWRTLQTDPEYLTERVQREHPERCVWAQHRTMLNNHAVVERMTEQQLAWALYAVHGWSYGQKGTSFNPPHGARARLSTKVRQFRNAHRLLRGAKLTNLDFREVLTEDRGVAYLDPPYMMATGNGYYAHRFRHLDHLDLADILLARKSPWLLSYDEHPAVRYRYRACRIEPLVVGRGLGGPTRMYSELLIDPIRK
jgi:DNA adenine methylase